MKKRILSILLTLIMMVCLMPTAVQAEEGEAESRGGASTTETVTQPSGGEHTEGVESVSQNGESPTAEIFSSTNAAGVLQTASVSSEDELVAALADSIVNLITLKNDIAVSTTLTVDRAVTLDLVGYMLEITGSGSVIKVADGGHLTLKDSDLTATYKFTPDANGLWKWGTSGTMTINGGVIYGGNAENGGGVYVEGGGQFTMTGGNIVGCGSSKGKGGGVKVDGGGKFEMNGDAAAIIGCVAAKGSGVYVAENATFIMNGGTIRDCVFSWEGGGVYNAGQFTMNGGTIRNCAAAAGGAVYHDSSAPLILNGTIISDNSAALEPIYAQCDARGTVIIGADADIQANMYLSDFTVHANGGVIRGDLYAHWAITISVDEGVTKGTIFYGKLTGSCNYNVNGVAVTYQVNSADYATQFLNSGSRATQPADPTKPGCTFDGWYKTDGTKWDFNTDVTENITLAGWQYLPVDNASALESALADNTVDAIRLTKDIDIDKNLNVDRAVILDLNGHVLRYYNANVLAGQINVNGNGDLTLVDSNPDVEHRFTDLYGGGLWILDETNGDKIAKGGIITACVVYVYGGTFTMDGGSFVGSQGHAGAVAVENGGTFTMNAGLIRNCYSAGSGAVYVIDSTATLNGGSIEECYLYYNLVGMYLIRGVVIANGGKVDGMVYIDENSKITSSAGASGVTTFRGELRMALNSTVEHGIYYGGITVWQGSTISGLTVTYKDGDADYAKQILTSGKTATRPDDPTKPGYIFDSWRTADGTPWDYTTPVTEDMTLTAHWTINTGDVTNEQELTNALADASVGQIRLTADIDISQDLSVTRAVILDLNGHVLRQITNNCVSFKVESGGDLTLIDSNPTAEHGFTPDSDGLWVWDETGGTKTVKGGVITGNAQGRSGSIHVEEGTFTMTAGNLVGCNVYGASSSIGISCGAVYVDANSKFNMTGGAIQGCLVRQGNGGGVYVNGGQFTMTGGAITDCTVDGFGGGVYVLSGTFKLDDGDIRGCTAGGGGGVFVYMKGSTRGIFEMTGGSIADCTAGKGSALYLYNGIMYANGGTVDGTVWVDDIAYPDMDSKITTNGITGVTSFKKGARTRGANSRIEYGIFYGGITGDGTVSGVTVTYLIDGAEYAKQMLPSAGLATRPDDPAAKTGYTFGGWNKTDGTAWDYAKDTVTGDITLYAKWIPNTHKLTFDANGGVVTPKTKDVTYGELFGELPVPVREGYIFMGWFDAQGSTQYDATTQLDKDENITLYAKWTLCDHKSSTKQPNCTDPAICTECAGTIPAIGHDFGTPDYKWNGTECTAHRVCANDASHEESETVTAAVNVTQNKNCEQDELSTYTATFKNKAFATQTKQNVVTANKLGHAYGTPEYTWNGTECTAHRVCANDASHEESETVTAAVNVTQNKNCEQDELSTYTATFKNKAFATQTKQNVVTANKLGHAYGTPEYTWNGTECTAHRVCANDASHEESETVTAAVNVTQNKNCEQDELSTYTATFTNAAFAAQTKQNVVTANKLGHNFTLAQHDKTQHWNKCSRCDATDTKANHTGGKATCTEQAVCTVCGVKYGNALGHDFKVPQHNETQHWNKCSRCDATDKKADHTGGKATCTERAVCTVCGVKYGKVLGHDFGTPDYKWNGTECTAHRVCANDASHEESETVTAAVNVTQNRGCVQDELSTYTATFKNKAFATQTKQNVVTANKLGHDFTVPQHDETQHWNKCSRCDTTDAKMNHTGGKATCIEQAVCEVCHSPYGEFNGTNHVGGTKIRNRKSQNCTENGYTGDTYCKGCGKKLSSGTNINADGHKGGTASCIDKAECEVCHEKYGEPDKNNHIGLEKVNATPATAASTGTIEYWHCTACGKVFADADGKREINSEDTVAKKLAPSILDGANGKWKKGDENGLTFKSDAAFSDFVEVLVDGKTVAPENYTKREDGIIVELKASYLETLAEGEYTLSICSASGDATTKFTVEAEAVTSSTDSTNIEVWVIIIGVVALGAGIAVVVFVARKRKTA